jgi:PAS domain S-box-containing protein
LVDFVTKKEKQRRQRARPIRQWHESSFKALLDHAPDLISRFDRNYRHLYVNPMIEEFAGISPADIIGKSNRELGMPAALVSEWERIIDDVFSSGQPQITEFDFSSPDGNRFFQARLTPEFGRDGSVVSVLSVVRDLTTYKQAEGASRRLNEQLEERVAERTAQLQEANEALARKVAELQQLEQELTRRNVELQATTEELESFAYSVSHDLRAPLRAIDGFGMALLQDHADELSANGRHYLERMRAASRRMGLLIDDLLQLSRVTRSSLHYQSVNLSHLAHTILAELKEGEPSRQVDLAVQDHLIVEADARLMRILMANLLSNAWKFTRGRAAARIEVGALGDHPAVAASAAPAEESAGQVYYVADNGVGFNMAYADKLFGAFQRLHSEREFEGTGIGLATAQRIVRRHRGRIWGEAAEGAGARFYFTLNEGEERERNQDNFTG